MQQQTFNFSEGELLLVDKPLTWTSFDVVNKLRYATGIRKVGHAGTLDPLATGLLIVCVGRKATKKIDSLQGLDKEYTGIITLGGVRPSYDMETEVTETFAVDHLTEADIIKTTHTFLGQIEQIPPAFSAIKVNGVPLYKKARKGEKVVAKSRSVRIDEFEITKIALPEIHFRIVCSKGTYIRSIAHDFGKALNNGGYLSQLCRTKIDKYELKNAWNLDELVATIKAFREQTELS